MSKYITDEMLDKGATEARAWGVKSSHGGWSDEETQRNCTQDILEAAAPLIAAKALRDAADDFATTLSGRRDVQGILRARAAKLLGAER